MKKMRVIALVAALVAGLAIYKFLDVISQPQETPRTPVVVAAADIPENTTITADMVTLQPVATEALLKNCVRDTESVIGMVVSSDVLAGEQIVTDRLVRVGETESSSNTLAYVVQPGMRAVSVAVSATTGLSTLIKPGDHVDLVLNYAMDKTLPTGETQQVPASRLLMQDIEVLAVDATMSRAGVTPDVGYGTVTLMVTPEQAVEVSYSENNGSLRLILRSALDTEQAAPSVVTNETIQH